MQTLILNHQSIAFLSDTHGKHRNLNIPANIDIIIHCGDVCTDGDEDEIIDFFEWFAQLDIPHKIFVHGNHDLPFELEPEKSRELIPRGVIWLNDKVIRIKDIKIAGLSAFPFFHNPDELNSVDIVVSHYPPLGILDDGFGSAEIGRMVKQITPKYHVFGHNHKDFGKISYKNIQYINASLYHQLCQKENPSHDIVSSSKN